ncbi:phage tail protein [Pseudomonas sp. FFUP_PS_473]|uniref:phage tail protein n=1 Tax=Pseudomonas sp. FFUP_PS_473 TaxID=2060418 RepID=UPI000C7E7CA1|nr:tail fiber protein [Pseudomonas sp. FFUP_PS_473]PLP95592.1 phage tail protein [Pseudomonas sp. FFUP_PS_473]
MSEPYLAEIKMFAGNYAPKGYAFCQGQLMAVQQNQALFALIGNLYGGTYPNNFALPNFVGATPIGQGPTPNGGAVFTVGDVGGAETVTLSVNNLPVHTHLLSASTDDGVVNAPTTTSFLAAAVDAAGSPLNIYGEYGNPVTPMDTQLAPQAIGHAGNSVPLSVRNPYLAVSFIIALSGIFPSRN